MNFTFLSHFALWINGLKAGHPGKTRVAANAFWLYLDKALRMGVGLVVGLWVARYLGPERYGLLSYALAFGNMLGPLAGLGLDSITVRDLVNQPERRGQLLGTYVALRLSAGLATLVLAFGAALWWHPGSPLTWLLIGLAAAMPLVQAFDAVDLYFQSRVESKFTVMAKGCGFLLASLFRVALLVGGAPLWAFGLAVLLETALNSGALLAAYRARTDGFSDWSADPGTAWRLLKVSWPLIFSGLAIAVYMRIDQIMIKSMLGDGPTGIYAAAVKVSELWYFIPIAVVTSSFPVLLETRRQDAGQYRRRLQKLFSLLVLLGCAAGGILWAASAPLIRLLFGSDYAAAGAVLAVHAWTGVFVGLGVARETCLVTEGLTRISLASTVAGAVLNVGINLLLIPKMGAKGAALATLAAQAFTTVLSMAFFRETRPLFAMQMKAFLLRGLFS
jgi:PST family polysaccharide transporter